MCLDREVTQGILSPRELNIVRSTPNARSRPPPVNAQPPETTINSRDRCDLPDGSEVGCDETTGINRLLNTITVSL